MKKEKHGFNGAWVLTAAALASKALGALYRMPLTRILGAHGMGLYQSVYPLYALLVTLGAGGLCAAASVLTAEAESGGKRFSVPRALLCSLAVTLPLALLGAAFSRILSRAAGAGEAWLSLLLLCALLPLSGITALYRGYFQGKGRAGSSAAAQLCEQTVRLLCGLGFAAFLGRISVPLAVLGAALGVCFSEGAGVLVSLLCYAGRKRAHRTKAADSEAQTALASEAAAELFPAPLENLQTLETEDRPAGLFKRLYAVALPVAAGLAVLPLCGALDSFIVVNLLVRGGAKKDSATALYGLVSGPCAALIALPAVCTLGLANMLLPRISALRKRGEPVWPHLKRAFCFALLVGLAVGGGLFAFAPLVLRLLYGAGVPSGGVFLLRVCSLAVPCVSVLQIATAALQGVGKASVPFFSLLFAAAVKEIVNLVLLPRVGSVGFALSTVLFYAFACGADLLFLAFCLRPQKAVVAPLSTSGGNLSN